MKAILTVEIKQQDGSKGNKRLLFDTEKATEVCDVINGFGYVVQTIFLSPGGWLFYRNNNTEVLTIANQEEARDYIAERYPDKYEELFGKVEEA